MSMNGDYMYSATIGIRRDSMRNDFRPNYLSHHGIDGMKWGIQNGPPYPLDKQTHNKVVKKASGEKKGLIESMKAKSAAKKRANKRAAALAKARAARAEKLKKEQAEKKLMEDKDRVLKSGSAAELAKYKGRLSNKELQDAWNRIELEAKILSKAQAETVSPDKVKEFFDKLETISGYVKKGTDAVKIGIDAYDTIADVYNTFGNPNEPIKKVRGGNQNNEKKEKNNDNNSFSKDELEKLLKKYSNSNNNQNNDDNKKKKKN